MPIKFTEKGVEVVDYFIMLPFASIFLEEGYAPAMNLHSGGGLSCRLWKGKID